LPVAVRGSSLTILISRGRWWGASAPSRNRRRSARSASGSADFEWRNGALPRLSLAAPGALRLRRLSGRLTLRDRTLTFSAAHLDAPGGPYSLSGTASFTRELDLTLIGRDSRQYSVTGALARPRVSLPPPVGR